MRAPPQLTRQQAGSNSTMCARFQLVVNTPPIPPFEFRVSSFGSFGSFGSSRPLSTIHYPLSTAVSQSAPAVPCKRLRNVLYCKVESEHNQAGPERAASHNCPPTMPRPPTMSTCSEPNVRILPQANFAPGSAGNNSKCTDLPSAASPTHSVMTPAMQPMPAPPAPGSVSCHEKHAAVAVLRTFGTRTKYFARFYDKNGREMPTSVSCYESPCQYPVTRSEEKILKTGLNWSQQRIRYPIDALPIPDFPKIHSHFTSQYDALGPIPNRIGRILAYMRGFPDKETGATTDFEPDFEPDFGARRRCGPRPGPLLAQKVGRLHPRHRRSIARNAHSATDESSRHVAVP